MGDEAATLSIWGGAAIVAFAALLSALLILLLHPLLWRYTLAKPNPRSSHTTPTPQGGGIAVIGATIVATYGAFSTLAAGGPAPLMPLVPLLAAVALMGTVGAADDIRPIPVLPRLLLQALAVALVIQSLPDAVRIVPVLPWSIERALLVIGGLWFVNLVNFMDGLDWMTVAEVVPITASLVVLGAAHALAGEGVVLALALGGAMLGFAWFNRPVARLFLGDVGSLPIGLLLGSLLLLLAAGGHLAAALLLPLYYLADATITLVRRLARGERVWQAHRTHFYQRATDRGFSVTEIAGLVFAVNLGLGALALFTVLAPGRATDIAALVAGGVLVAGLLAAFARGKKRSG